MTRRPAEVLLADHPDLWTLDFGRGHVRRAPGVDVVAFGDRDPVATLRRGVSVLNDPTAHGVPETTWWIGIGTALGLARDRGFIGWDTDIDVRVLADYRDPAASRAYAKALADAFAPLGLEVFRELYWDHRPMQVAFVDRANDDLVFDVCFFHEGAVDDHLVSYNRRHYREKPRHLIDDATAQIWPGVADVIVNVPTPVEAYCEWRYGDGWRTPTRSRDLEVEDQPALQPIPTVTVLTYGTFDGFHHGHLNLLRRAKDFGDRLVVGVVSDDVLAIKEKTHTLGETERAAVVAAIECVDEVFIQTELDQKESDIERFGVDYLVVGDDWAHHPRFEQVRGYRGVELVYLERTPDVSSTLLRSGNGHTATNATESRGVLARLVRAFRRS